MPVTTSDGSATRFITEACLLQPDTRVSAPDFRAAYEAWCVTQKLPPLTARAIGKAVALHPSVSLIRSNGTRFYKGISLL